MNKTIWIVLIVILVGAGVYIYLKNSYKTPRPSSEPAQTQNAPPAPAPNLESSDAPETPEVNANVIIYTNSGFSPASLAIKAGDAIIFTNQSSEQMWPASAPHPTHTNYPEFDAKIGYVAGESYTFTFTKTGNWKYHNHLNPGRTGTVVVE